jgi:hypothetical protein
MEGATAKFKNHQRFLYRPRHIHTCQKRNLKIVPDRRMRVKQTLSTRRCEMQKYCECMPIIINCAHVKCRM